MYESTPCNAVKRVAESVMWLAAGSLCVISPSGSSRGRRGVPGLHAERTARGDADAQEAHFSARRECVHGSSFKFTTQQCGFSLFICPVLLFSNRSTA